MSRHAAPAPRRDNKLEELAATLRGRIRAGRYVAGALLPTVRDLAIELGASVPTVSRALGLLVEQGFIATDGRRGTRVVDHPPHRHRFALVLPGAPDARGVYASLHWQSLAAAARALARDPASAVELFHAINRHGELAEHHRLLAAVRDEGFAGLVICEPFRGGEWLELGGVRLPVIGGAPVDRPERGAIRLNQSDFRRRTLDHARARGCKRIAAVMDASGDALAAVADLRAAALERGLDCPEHRVLAAPLEARGWARHAVQALMRAPRAQRPDALLICDDNLVAEAAAGLDAAGVEADHLELVVHANFPSPPQTKRPATRFGWDQREFLDEALAAIGGWLDHRHPLGARVLPVRSEDEAIRRAERGSR